MKVAQSRLTAQGQISVPAKIRKILALIAGSTLEWDADGDRVTVRRAGKHASEELHRAMFAHPPRPRTLAELRDGVRKNIRARHARR